LKETAERVNYKLARFKKNSRKTFIQEYFPWACHDTEAGAENIFSIGFSKLERLSVVDIFETVYCCFKIRQWGY